MASDVTDVCEKLQGVQLQLSLTLTRNEEVLKHLEEAEKIVESNGSAVDKERFKKNMELSRAVSKKLEENIRLQCESLSQAVTELETRTAENQPLNVETSHFSPCHRSSSLSEQKSTLEFQLRSQLNHNVALHEEKAELETRLKEHMTTLKESGRQADKLEEELVETKRQIKDLLDLFEGKALEAEKRISELHVAMNGTQERAQKFQAMYEAEKEANLRRERAEKERMQARMSLVEEGNEGDSEDGGLGPVLVSSRPQTSVKRAKSAPINPQNVDPLYLSVIEENKRLKAEVERLRVDNADLMIKSKRSQRDIETIQNHVATCSTQREELRRRLRKEQDEHRKLSTSMTRQASDWIMQKKMVKEIDHHTKVSKVLPESTLTASTRYRSHPIKANEDKPRNIPVESWSSDNPLRAV
ncbi:uncharacterized protein [Diadema antillarum]|uniref:uncharacterized protein n=1 Tax=Diadema antillarum TaxID=105358 RepID=UPI003A87709B